MTYRGDPVAFRGALTVVAVLGSALLLVAELSVLYTVVVGALETPRRSVTGGSSHGYALALVAAGAVAMTVIARRGSRVAAGALVTLGAVALLVALAVDLPDTRRSGSLREAVSFEDARAKSGRGLALELAGAIALLVAGTGLLVTGSAGAGRGPAAPTRGARAAGRRSELSAGDELSVGPGSRWPAGDEPSVGRGSERSASDDLSVGHPERPAGDEPSATERAAQRTARRRRGATPPGS